MLKKNQTAEAVITDVNNLGYGVTRVDGTVVFVKGGVTGDRVTVRIIKATKDYGVAVILGQLAYSEHREKPLCPVSGRCGGCVYQHVSYRYEEELKRGYVASAMKKAGLDQITVHPLSGSSPSRYRNKAQYPLTRLADGTVAGGFYAGHTHSVIPSDDCLLQPECFSAILKTVCRLLTRYRVPLYEEETHKGLIRHLCLRRGDGGVSVLFVVNGTSFPHQTEICAELTAAHPEIALVGINENRSCGNEILGKGYLPLYGGNFITDTLCGVRLRISPLSFYQVNHDACERLYEKAAELLAPCAEDTLLDLYCGIGSIGLSMADRVGTLFGIEIIPEAIENAKQNAADNGIQNARFFVGDSADMNCLIGTASVTAAIVDPPRKGLAPSVIGDLAALAPKRIVYVSCNPDTLARDLVLFREKGYETRDAYPFDLFPRTGHVESVVLLSRA